MTFDEGERSLLVAIAKGRMTFVLLFIPVIRKSLYYIIFRFGDGRINLSFSILRWLSENNCCCFIAAKTYP